MCMREYSRTFVVDLLIVAILLVASCQFPTVSAGDEPTGATPAVTDEEIQQWVKQLGDEDFQTREAAEGALVKAGNAAFDVLESMPPSEDVEVRLRVQRAVKAMQEAAVEELRAKGAHFSRRGDVLKKTGATDYNYFTISNPKLRDEDLAPLKRLKHLEYVKIEESPVSDGVMVHLHGMSQLHNVSLNGTQITDEGVKHLIHFPLLEVVTLSKTKITNDSLAYLAKLPKLARLSLFDTRVDGEGLAHLAPLKHQLISLLLERTHVEDEDLRHLRDFVKLRFLRINDTNITGDGLRYIRSLPELEWLLMNSIDLKEEALVHAAQMPALKRISLKDTGVTLEGLRILQSARCLERIYVSAKSFTVEEVQTIQEQFDDRDDVDRTVIRRL